MAVEDSLISFPEMDAHVRSGAPFAFNLAVRLIYFSYTLSCVHCAQPTRGCSEHSVYQPVTMIRFHIILWWRRRMSRMYYNMPDGFKVDSTKAKSKKVTWVTNK